MISQRGDSLLDRRLLVNIGKGGVGKSTLTAAMAVAASFRGKRVLVCEVRTRERMSSLLGAPPVGSAIGRLREGIDGVVLEPKEAMREYAMMQLRHRALYQAVFENRWVSKFLGFLPSLPELVMLGKALFHVREGRWDLVLLDSPATGHGITFLGVPQALRNTLPSGALRSEADWMHDLLVDPETTAINLVTLPEELAVNETRELAERTESSLGMSLGWLFLNRHVAGRFSREECDALLGGLGSPVLDAAAQAAAIHRLRSELSARYEEELRSLGLPLLPIPWLHPEEELGPASVEEIAALLEARL